MKNRLNLVTTVISAMILNSCGDKATSNSEVATQEYKTYVGECTPPATENEFFNKAKEYITYESAFDSETILTDPLSYRIKFDPAVVASALPNATISSNVAAPLTLGKEFVMSTDKKLILMRRIKKSTLDGTTCTIGFYAGQKRNTVDRERLRTLSQCDAVVFNYNGQGVCLTASGGAVNMEKLSPKYAERLISSRSDMSGDSTQNHNNKKPFSQKRIENGEIIVDTKRISE